MVKVMIIFTPNMNQSLGSIVIVTIAKSDFFFKIHLVTTLYLQAALYNHIHFQAVAAVPKPPYFNFLFNFEFLRFSRTCRNYEIWNIFTKNECVLLLFYSDAIFPSGVFIAYKIFVNLVHCQTDITHKN